MGVPVRVQNIPVVLESRYRSIIEGFTWITHNTIIVMEDQIRGIRDVRAQGRKG